MKKKLKVMASCRYVMFSRILCPCTQEFEENNHFLRAELNNTQQQLQAETESLRGQVC